MLPDWLLIARDCRVQTDRLGVVGCLLDPLITVNASCSHSCEDWQKLGTA